MQRMVKNLIAQVIACVIRKSCGNPNFIEALNKRFLVGKITPVCNGTFGFNKITMRLITITIRRAKIFEIRC